MKKIMVKVAVFEGHVEKQSYTLPVDGLPLMEEMVELPPMRAMALAAGDAVRDVYVKLLPIYGQKGIEGEYHG